MGDDYLFYVKSIATFALTWVYYFSLSQCVLAVIHNSAVAAASFLLTQ